MKALPACVTRKDRIVKRTQIATKQYSTVSACKWPLLKGLLFVNAFDSAVTQRGTYASDSDTHTNVTGIRNQSTEKTYQYFAIAKSGSIKSGTKALKNKQKKSHLIQGVVSRIVGLQLIFRSDFWKN